MKEPAQRTVFAGLDGCTDAELPEWYAEQKPVDEPASFAEAIRDLPRAVETRVAYQNPYVDEWIETDQNALDKFAEIGQTNENWAEFVTYEKMA